MITLLTDASAETILQQVHDLAGELDSLYTSDKSNLVAALNEILGKLGTLASLSTAAKGNLVAAINELNSGKAATSTVGTLSSLNTSAKGSAVAAINEVNTGKNTNATNIGTLSTLGTSSKTTLVGAINEVNTGKNTNASNISTLTSSVGTLSSLGTSAKGSLVAAINEVNSGRSTNASAIGTLSSLGTSAKGNLVAAINEVNSGRSTNATNINTNKSAIGTLTSLNTSAKGNLVAAINEVNTGRGTNATNIGTLSSLTTSTKTNLVAAVNSVKADVTALDTSVASRIAILTDYKNNGNHNSIYRGKNLGSSFTAAQSAAIRAGTFDDIYVGDYWTISHPAYSWTDSSGTVHNEAASSKTIRVMGLDYFLQKGDTPTTAHHVVVTTDVTIFGSKMNSTATTAGGYIGSFMYKDSLKRMEAFYAAMVGADHILTHRDYLSNAVTDGVVSGGAWVDRKVDLFNEAMVYGSFIKTANSASRTATICSAQLPAFALYPKLIVAGSGDSRRNWWLRDVYSASQFAYVNSLGNSLVGAANTSPTGNIRAYALIY